MTERLIAEQLPTKKWNVAKISLPHSILFEVQVIQSVTTLTRDLFLGCISFTLSEFLP